MGGSVAARRILAVDDSRTMRDMVSVTLLGAGYEVLIAEDGEDAIRVLAAANDEVDLVITDLNMPKLDGFGLIRRLRADPTYRLTPILMLTTESSAEKKAEGRAAGATGWIVKPFEPDKLLSVVRRVMP
ncbi:MAG: response regulator [Rhodospirillales bacterium]|nr:response regulator [Rhodospirillales bacterium]